MPLSHETYLARIADVTAAFREAGLDALVAYGLGSTLGPGSRSHGSMRYLCGWDSQHTASVLLLRPGQEPVLLVTNIFSLFYGRDHFTLGTVAFVPPAELGAAVARHLGDGPGAGRRYGIVGRAEMPAPVWEALSGAVPEAAWIDSTALIDRRRVVKSAEELARHERAAALCDMLFETFRREIRHGRPGFQLQAEIERAARYAGSEFCKTWLTIGPEADYCRSLVAECARVPADGDQVLLGLYLSLDGFWGHAIRSGSIGRPRPAHVRAHAIATAMQDAMSDALRPGRDLNDVQAAADRVLAARLDADERSRLFYFRHAHGLGYSYEDPIVTAPFPQPYAPAPLSPPLPAEPGMLFELHPNLFVPGLGGGSVGDMVAVTETGNRRLTAYPRDLVDWSA